MTLCLDPFVNAECAFAHAHIQGWSENFRAGFETFLRQDLILRKGDLKWAESYRAHCPIEGTKAEDYQLRLVEGGDDGRVIAGIHFFGGDVTRPFVGVLARSGPWASEAQASRWVARLKAEFLLFSPESVWVFQWRGAAEVDFVSMGGKRDQWLVGARLDALAPPSPTELVLEARATLENYGNVQAAYAAYHEDNPSMVDRVLITEEASLAACAKAGGLAEATLDGSWAGILAVERANERGLEGWLIVEEVLAKHARGRGLGAALQVEGLRSLGLPPQAWILGTIDAANTASLRTARRAGRTYLGSWVFLGEA